MTAQSNKYSMIFVCFRFKNFQTEPNSIIQKIDNIRESYE